MYKLLALDLDGTVLNSERQINLPLLQVIHRLPDNIHVMVVTGRHHTAAKLYHQQLKLKTPIICCNGTYIYDYQSSEVLYENAIPKESAVEFLSLCDQYQLKKIMYVKDSMLYDESNPVSYMPRMYNWANTFPEYDRPSILKADDFASLVDSNDYVWKFVVEGEDESVQAFCQLPFIQSEFSAEQVMPSRFECARKGNTKGSRLTNYIDTLGISAQQVVAIGDNHNDISMIKLAGMGVTLEHADEIVKQAADHVLDCDNDDEYGLANFISSLFSNKNSY